MCENKRLLGCVVSVCSSHSLAFASSIEDLGSVFSHLGNVFLSCLCALSENVYANPT